MSFNSFSAVVTVVTDMETKSIKGGTLTKCRGAHEFSYKDNSTIYLGLSFWGAKAAAAEKVLKKGDRLFVKGSLNFNTVGDKTYYDLNVEDFMKVSNGNGGGEKSSSKPRGEKVEALAAEVDVEIPF